MAPFSDFFNSFRPIYASAGVTLLVIVLLAAIDPAVAVKMIKDDGIVQIATATLLCLAAMIAVVRAAQRPLRMVSWLEASYILAIYCMREMDLHRMLTAEHVTRMKLYTGPYPIEQKLIGGAVMILFIIAALHFAYTHQRAFFQALRSKVPRAWFLVAWAILLFGAQIIDKPRIFRGILFKTLAEEAMEFGASLMMVILVFSFYVASKRTGSCRQ